MRPRPNRRPPADPANWWPPTPEIARVAMRVRLDEAGACRIEARRLTLARRYTEAEEMERLGRRHDEVATAYQAKFWPVGLAVVPPPRLSAWARGHTE